MSLVSKAMARAGASIEGVKPPEPNDAHFASSEDGSAAAAPEVEPTLLDTPRFFVQPPPLPYTESRPHIRQEDGGDLPVSAVIRIVRQRWMLILSTVAVAMGCAVAYNALATRIYEARAQVLIEPDSAEIVPFRPVVSADFGRLDYFVTQMEVIRSRALAESTLERMKLLSKDTTRRASQVAQFQGALTVSPVRTVSGDSRVVNITFRSSDPPLAARAANELAQEYVDQNLQVRRQGSRQAALWLNQRLGELRDDVNASQRALQQYRERRNTVSLDGSQNVVTQKLTQLNTAMTTARTERLERQTMYDQLMALQKRGEPLDTFPPIMSNGFIQSIKAELASLQRERAQLAERLGELHPDMIRVDSAIADAQRRLDAEMRKVVDSVRNDFNTSVARERAMNDVLEQQKREVLALDQDSIGYSALQRDAASTQQLFDSVLQRVKETEVAGELQTNNTRVLDVAEVPRGYVWPRVWLNLTIAFLGGLFIALTFATILEYSNPRIARTADVEAALHVPLLGSAPRLALLRKGRLSANALPPAFQEAFRGIRTRILLSPSSADTRAIVVTSTTSGEGKTVVASSLATSLATGGRRVLLIDADMRRPKQHDMFRISPSPGLSDVLVGTAQPSDAIVEMTPRGLFVIPAGTSVKSPSDLLDGVRLKELIVALTQVFDVIVLDSPPVMGVADASILAHAATNVVFVVGSGTPTRELAQIALERIASVQARIVGVVLNKAHNDASTYGYYGSDAYDDDDFAASVVRPPAHG